MILQDLEPLPSFDCLKDIQVFHASLSGSYDSRDQFLKVAILNSHFFWVYIHYELMHCFYFL